MQEKPTCQKLEEEIKSLNKRLEICNNKDKFISYFNNSHAPMLQICPDTNQIINVNTAAVRFYGFTKKELLNKKIDDLNIMPSHEIKSLMKKAIKSKSILHKHKHKVASGRIIDVEVYASPFNIDGKKYMMTTMLDVSMRIKAELKLKNSEEFYKSLMENSSDAISIIDAKGNSIFRSASYEKVMGYTAAEMLNKNVFELIYADDKEILLTQLKSSLDRPDQVQNIVFRAYHKDGTLRYLEGTGKNMLKSPVIKGFVVNYRDVTDRIKAEKALRKSEANYKSIIDNLTDVYYKADANGKLIFASRSSLAMFGYSSMNEIIGNSIENLYPNSNQRKEFTSLLTKNGRVKNYHASLLRNDGSQIYVEVNASIVLDENGEYCGVEGIVRDITDRKEAELALQKSEENLKQLLKTKDRLFSIIAHDLKSPFNAIIGFSDLLSNNFDTFNINQKKKFINIIRESSENAYKLLENLLLWSRSQQGEMDYKPDKESLYLLSFATIEFLKHTIQNKNIEISNQISEKVNVKVDKNMVLTIFRNIINNAIKFTKKGGSISLSSSLFTDKNNQKFVKITIKDSGVGIPKHIIEKLFLITENISTTGTEDELGTGLGLIICKEFIDKHSGEIWVESKVGKGSSFNFTLPVVL